ncbi:MAG: hypothetical protein RR356_03065 [Bacteroidales bacterium]
MKLTTGFLRRSQLFWSLFIGMGALWGCTMMWIDPSGEMWGMTPLLSSMQVLPFPDFFFQNFIFSGICLLCVNGISNLITFFMIIRHHRDAPLAGIICGVILMLWICIQFIIFPFNGLSTSYFIFGLLQAGNGMLWSINGKRNKTSENNTKENQ